MRKNFSQITTGKEMKQTIEENPIWIPLQTTYCKELQVAEFLRDSEIPYYIPQTYELQDAKDGSERCERILVPAIHNLLNECPHVPKLAKFKPPRCPIGVYWNTLCLMRDVWTIKTYMI